MHPLYAKLYSYPYYDNMHGLTLRTLKWWPSCLSGLSSRSIRAPKHFPDIVLYTDAAYDNCIDSPAAIFLDRESNFRRMASGLQPLIVRVLSAKASDRLLKMFADTSVIFGLELTAVTIAIYEERFSLSNRTVAVFVGNNLVLGALAKSQTGGRVARDMLSAMWLLGADLNISMWFERVPSSSNISDIPNRDTIPPSPLLLFALFLFWVIGWIGSLTFWNINLIRGLV